jgi:hypothetical protein
MPLFRRPSCVRRCASYSQTVNSTGDAPVCGAYVRLKLGTGDQFRPSRENSRTKLQDVVTDSRAGFPSSNLKVQYVRPAKRPAQFFQSKDDKLPLGRLRLTLSTRCM